LGSSHARDQINFKKIGTARVNGKANPTSQAALGYRSSKLQVKGGGGGEETDGGNMQYGEKVHSARPEVR